MASRSPYQIQLVQSISESISPWFSEQFPQTHSTVLEDPALSSKGDKRRPCGRISDINVHLVGQDMNPWRKKDVLPARGNKHGTLTLQHGCCRLHLLWPFSKMFKMDRAYVSKTTSLRLMTDRTWGTGKTKG